jgi:hypothetical protein
MKRFILLTLPIALVACTPTGITSIPPSPQAVAETTILDEQAALGVELAYQAAALAALTAMKSGLVDAKTKVEIAKADTFAYAQVQKVRAAYDAGNSASYAQTLPVARTAVGSLLALVKGK